MKVKSYKDLDVWNKGIEIVDKIYKLTSSFDEQERFGLTAQMRRAAVSIPSNIAEGFMRQFSKEYIQFLYIALGSCAELETQLIIADKRKYLPEQIEFAALNDVLNHECRMLMNLIKSLR